MTTIEVDKMSKTECLQAMEALWDSLLHEETEIDSPEWHESVLGERKKNIEEGNAQFFSIEEVRSAHR